MGTVALSGAVPSSETDSVAVSVRSRSLSRTSSPSVAATESSIARRWSGSLDGSTATDVSPVTARSWWVTACSSPRR
jgi:hypothetical protein